MSVSLPLCISALFSSHPLPESGDGPGCSSVHVHAGSIEVVREHGIGGKDETEWEIRKELVRMRRCAPDNQGQRSTRAAAEFVYLRRMFRFVRYLTNDADRNEVRTKRWSMQITVFILAGFNAESTRSNFCVFDFHVRRFFYFLSLLLFFVFLIFTVLCTCNAS